MLTQVTLEDIYPLSIGAGILGTGGGGSPYIGALHLRNTIRERGPARVLDPMQLADDARVVVVGYIGAPTAGIEKMPQGEELVRAVRLLEDHLQCSFDAIAIAEIGGSNSLGPLVCGLQAGIPVVDADGMGRAFPETQMITYLFPGDVQVSPFAMVDAGNNSVIFPHTASALWTERLARNLAVCMGATAGLAGFTMSGKQMREYCVPYTLSLAHRLGKRVITAQKDGEDVPHAIAETLCGHILFRGKIVDLFRRTTKGFARGTLKLESFDGQDQLRIEFQNEFLIAYLNEQVEITVPDLICIVMEETGEPVATELLRYGMRVAVLGVPAAAGLKSPTALTFVGPKAFGYDVEFQPLPGEAIGVPQPTIS